MKQVFPFIFKVFIVAVLLFSFSCSKQKMEERKNLTVVFYNVENLFDMEDEPNKQDEEFTPNGDKKWTPEKYNKKLADLSKVLSSVSAKELPGIIGLGEVENRKVVEDLVKTGELAKGNYEVVQYESPDFRGIDCALVFRKDKFKLIESFPIHIEFKSEPDYKTRDILYVKGKTINREEFHIFVNHWPSRIGGIEKSEPNRVEVAEILKSKIDSVLQKNAKANVIVMGDMNDEPNNKSLELTLNAKSPEIQNANLVNLMFPEFTKGNGSYNFRGDWNMLDNMVVSSGLLDEKGFRCIEKRGKVFHQEWMEYKNKNGEMSPNRTYGGPNYYGGVSDHFPVYFMLSR